MKPAGVFKGCRDSQEFTFRVRETTVAAPHRPAAQRGLTGAGCLLVAKREFTVGGMARRPAGQCGYPESNSFAAPLWNLTQDLCRSEFHKKTRGGDPPFAQVPGHPCSHAVGTEPCPSPASSRSGSILATPTKICTRKARPPRLTPSASHVPLRTPTAAHKPEGVLREQWAPGWSAIHFRGRRIRSVGCYTLLSGCRLPWPPPDCPDPPTPFRHRE